jgi:hypothetical protein
MKMMNEELEEIEISTADMLEIVASGVDGVEFIDLPRLLRQAAFELRAKDEKIIDLYTSSLVGSSYVQ